MKLAKGVTLISLTIYIIAMTIVIAVVASISTFFYENTQDASDFVDPLTEYTNFNRFFSEEVNHNNIKILELKENWVAFDNGTQYTFVPKNKAIYRNQVKVCANVENCVFQQQIKNGKEQIIVTVKMGKMQEKRIEFTLEK